jgi:5-methyltetrahydropteroyltriglutamate--homocysteine methyltransferase
MIYSTDRILTTHAGSLPRPQGLMDMVLAKARGEPYDQSTLEVRLRAAVADVVQRQVECGLDIVNDGELSKPNFTDYVSARIAGCESRPGTGFRRLSMTARDERKFPEYFEAHRRPRYAGGATLPVCIGELRYVGQAELARDLDNFKAALAGVKVAGGFLPANTPGTIEHWMGNEYYKSDEEFLFAIAEAMREEYNAIVDAGFLLQIDDPDLPDGLGLPARHHFAGISQIRRAAHRRAKPWTARYSQRKSQVARMLGQFSRPAPRRHSIEGHHRSDLPGARWELFDRSVEPLP